MAAISAKGNAFTAKTQRVMRTISVGLFIGAAALLLTSLTPAWVDLVIAFAASILACSYCSYRLAKREHMHPVAMLVLYMVFGGVLIGLAVLLGLLPAERVALAVVALVTGAFVGLRIGAGFLPD